MARSDLTSEMLKKSRQTTEAMGLGQVEFREGLAEDLPVEDGWADVVISNGVITCAPTSEPSSRRSAACSGLAGGCSSPTSPTDGPSRPKRYATSTCGPAELPEGCPMRAGKRCSRTPGS
jgi:hypothetical protein